MYTTDCVNQIVCLIYYDYIPVNLYSTGFSGGLVEKDVIWQNNNLIKDQKIEKKTNSDVLIMRVEWYFTWNNMNQDTFISFLP